MLSNANNLQFFVITSLHRLGTRLVFGTEQIAIFIGELYFMLPFTVQVKHLIPFPGIEHIKIQ